MYNLNSYAKNLVENYENILQTKYKEFDDVAYVNQLKVLEAFKDNNIQPHHFNGSSGYGYDDSGREAIAKIYAQIFGTESAIVSPYLSSGTQAITHTLLGILRPKDTIFSITGKPYDTLLKAIFGDENKDIGSMKDFGINFEYVEYKQTKFDLLNIKKYLRENSPKIVYLQRSRGYSDRGSITIEQMKNIFITIKQLSPSSIIVVDNCYGEFTEKLEPTNVGADIIVGSLIKNPGGGIAPSGGYICGKKEHIELIACRVFSPSLVLETGSYIGGYKSFFQGIFMAPHVISGNKKGVLLCSATMNDLGYKCIPSVNDNISDIVCSIFFNDKNKLIQFCRNIQFASPVDSNALLEPWDMPGYDSKVIMAAGTFNQGSSIELSCDAPIKEPYIAYFQGGLTYEHIKIALVYAVNNLIVSN